MERSLDQWELLFRQSSFFEPNIEMWLFALEGFGGFNIVNIIGVQEHVNRDFHGNIVQALTDPGFGNLLNIRITQLINQLDRFNNNNSHRNRILFLTFIRMRLRDRNFALHYADHIRHLGEFHLTNRENAPQVPLREAIRKQVRRPAPVPANNPQGDSYCGHCTKFGHTTVNCRKAGGVQRNNRGIPVALGENPRCFICATRHKKWSDTVFHDSRNCGFRHPLSRIDLKRKCQACNWSMKRCWNCAEPICLNKICRDYGHRNSFCPRPRYQPLSTGYFRTAFNRMSLSDRMAAVGIQRIPRELRYLPDPNQAQGQQPQPNRGQFNPATMQSNLPTANQTLRDVGRSTSRNNVQSTATIDGKSTSKNDGQTSKNDDQSTSQNDGQSTTHNARQSASLSESQTSQEAMQTDDFVPEIDITEDILNICNNEDLAQKDICSFCIEQLEIEEIGILDCGHRYHLDCLNNWRKYQNFCPCCKGPIILKSTDIPVGAMKRDKTRWADEASPLSFHYNPELYQPPNTDMNNVLNPNFDPDLHHQENLHEDDPVNDVGAMLIQTIEIIQRESIDERAFRVLRDLAIAVRERGIDWDDALSHEYVAAVFYHLGRISFPRIRETILPAILEAIRTLEQYERVLTSLRQLSPDMGHHLQQIDYIKEAIRARREQLMRPFPDRVGAPNAANASINPEQLTIEFIRRSIEEFQGFAIRNYAMDHLGELETHIREHPIVWNDITYPLVGALLHRLTRSPDPQYRFTIMPLIFGQINSAAQLSIVEFYVNSNHPDNMRKHRMKPYLDECRARFA